MKLFKDNNVVKLVIFLVSDDKCYNLIELRKKINVSRATIYRITKHLYKLKIIKKYGSKYKLNKQNKYTISVLKIIDIIGGNNGKKVVAKESI